MNTSIALQTKKSSTVKNKFALNAFTYYTVLLLHKFWTEHLLCIEIQVNFIKKLPKHTKKFILLNYSDIKAYIVTKDLSTDPNLQWQKLADR